MTDDKIALRALLEKGSDAIFLRRDRDWDPRRRRRAARLEAVPRQLLPDLPRARRMAEKALTVIQEAYIQGIFTRSVDDLVRAMSMEGIGKS
jgi:putative transposase